MSTDSKAGGEAARLWATVVAPDGGDPLLVVADVPLLHTECGRRLWAGDHHVGVSADLLYVRVFKEGDCVALDDWWASDPTGSTAWRNLSEEVAAAAAAAASSFFMGDVELAVDGFSVEVAMDAEGEDVETDFFFWEDAGLPGVGPEGPRPREAAGPAASAAPVVAFVAFTDRFDSGVLLNGHTIYYEDVAWKNVGIKPRAVADDIAAALGTSVRARTARTDVDSGAPPADIVVGDDWDWSEVAAKVAAFLGAAAPPP